MYNGCRIEYKNIYAQLTNYQLIQFLNQRIGEKVQNALFVYDLETTGLEPETDDIIECTIYEYYTKSPVYHSLIRPTKQIPFEVVLLTKIQ
jgi:DNA polymerase III alpha subunit (gram-positive type)